MSNYPQDAFESYDGLPEVESIQSVRSKEELDEVFTQARYRKRLNIVLFTIIRRLRQYGTKHTCEPNEVLSEAYLRAKKRIDTKGEIPNIFAWLHYTSHNIIREVRKCEDRQQERAQRFRSELGTKGNDDIGESLTESNLLAVSQSVQKLSRLDQRILHHRQIVGLPWKEVCLVLAEEGLLDISTCTDNKTVERIRRRGSRALDNLRTGY
jgi:DNA-directed RNA polymerase specialized sigma24 family protein